MHSICISSGFYGKRAVKGTNDLADNMKFIRDTGFREIDWMFSVDFAMQDDLPAAMERVKSAAAAEGLRFRFAHLPFSYPKPDDAEGWERFRTASLRAIDAAVTLGVDCAAIHPYTFMNPDWKSFSRRRELPAAREFLAPYCEYAHKAGLPLAIENMRGAGQKAPQTIKRFGMEIEDIVDLADDMDEGVCWDTGHGNISMQEQYGAITYIGKRLREVHLNDNYGEDDIHIPIFTGLVDWSAVARALKDVGYAGALNFELNCSRAPEPIRPQYAAYIFAAANRFAEMVENA